LFGNQSCIEYTEWYFGYHRYWGRMDFEALRA